MIRRCVIMHAHERARNRNRETITMDHRWRNPNAVEQASKHSRVTRVTRVRTVRRAEDCPPYLCSANKRTFLRGCLSQPLPTNNGCRASVSDAKKRRFAAATAAKQRPGFQTPYNLFRRLRRYAVSVSTSVCKSKSNGLAASHSKAATAGYGMARGLRRAAPQPTCDRACAPLTARCDR